jgi:hypothetical protein
MNWNDAEYRRQVVRQTVSLQGSGLDEKVRILHDLGRDLVITHGAIFTKRPKRLHSSLFEIRPRGVIDFEVKALPRDQGEEQSLGIDSYAAKHGSAGYGRNPAQLFDHKLAIAWRNRHGLLGFRRPGVRPMPNSLRIFIDFAHAMERDSMHLAFGIHQLKGRGVLFRKRDLPRRDHDDPILGPIVIAQIKVPFGELGIPPNAIEQYVNGIIPVLQPEFCHQS